MRERYAEIRDLNATLRGHEHPPGLGRFLHHEHFDRYRKHFFSMSRTDDLTPTVARVYLTPFMVFNDVTIDQLIYTKATPAGNVRGCVYESVGYIPDGGNLLVDSGTIAMSALTNRKQALGIPNTTLINGLHWAGLMFSDGAATRCARPHSTMIDGDEPNDRWFDNPGGFGAFPAVCPATTRSIFGPIMYFRVASLP